MSVGDATLPVRRRGSRCGRRAVWIPSTDEAARWLVEQGMGSPVEAIWRGHPSHHATKPLGAVTWGPTISADTQRYEDCSDVE